MDVIESAVLRNENGNEVKATNEGSEFVDWLLSTGYLEEEDIFMDGDEIARDIAKVKEAAPKFYNLLMSLCGCSK